MKTKKHFNITKIYNQCPRNCSLTCHMSASCDSRTTNWENLMSSDEFTQLVKCW